MRLDEAILTLAGVDEETAQSIVQFEEAMRTVQPAMELYQRALAAIHGAPMVWYTQRRSPDWVRDFLPMLHYEPRIRKPRRDARRAHRRAMKRGRR